MVEERRKENEEGGESKENSWQIDQSVATMKSSVLFLPLRKLLRDSIRRPWRLQALSFSLVALPCSGRFKENRRKFSEQSSLKIIRSISSEWNRCKKYSGAYLSTSDREAAKREREIPIEEVLEPMSERTRNRSYRWRTRSEVLRLILIHDTFRWIARRTFVCNRLPIY